MEIPVYLFTGFLEAGKTQFIQGTLEDKKFDPSARTLLLVCEEGEEEYDASRFAVKNTFIEGIEKPEQLNAKKLSSLVKKHDAERVLVEYNGMWNLNDLYSAMPEEWIIYQEIFFADSETFEAYNANMRQLMVDKLQSCELVAVNRVTDNTDTMAIHKIIRGVNRRTDIIYEYINGELKRDDIEDPLPFDINAPIIEIADKDFALWYRDLMEEQEKYDGRTVRFCGMAVRNPQLDEKTMLIGRKIMTCCAADIAFRPIVCESDSVITAKNASWQTVTARVEIKKHKLYKDKAPVLKLIKIAEGAKPEDEVAVFY